MEEIHYTFYFMHSIFPMFRDIQSTKNTVIVFGCCVLKRPVYQWLSLFSIKTWLLGGVLREPVRALFKMADGCQRNRVVEFRCTREYWMIYRGPGFLAVIWFGSFPTSSPSPVSKASCLCLLVFLCVADRAYWREMGGGGGEEEEPNHIDDEKACSSINHFKINTLLNTPYTWKLYNTTWKFYGSHHCSLRL